MFSLTRIRASFPRLLLCGALVTSLLGPGTAWALSLDQVYTLLEAEVPEEAIIKKIQKDGSQFNLSPKDMLELKKRGATDKLIRFMLSTNTTKPKAPIAATPKPEEKKRELTPAEQAAEEARMREEKLRYEEEQRKREEAQRKAFANRVLQQAQKLAEDGQFVKSIQIYNKFVEEGVGGLPFAPDSDEAYTAKYGIANALARAGLIQSAANLLLDVVRAGPEKNFFDKAFLQLRDLRRKINYRPPELEDLTKFSVSGFDQKFQDSYYYFVGEFLNDFGVADQALPYLEKVTDKAEDYARAQYLIGLIAFQDESRGKQAQITDAMQAFQRAVLAGEKQADGRPVVDLAYLALARLAYEYQQFDAAIYYYKKISKNSPKLATAFYESGWTYFLKNDISRALGTFQALHSPYFSHRFYPELWILEATMYVNLCRKEYAEDAIKMFTERVIVLAPPLRDFLKRNRRPEEYYNNFTAAVNGTQKNMLPRKLQSPVLENVEFYNLYQTIKEIEREETVVKANLAALGQFGQETLSKLGQLRSERISEAGVVIQKTLRQTQKELDLYQDKLDQLRLDIAELEYQKLEAETAGQSQAQQATVKSGGSIAIAGSDSMAWPFEGEFWKDEIGAYRSFLKSQCKEDAPQLNTTEAQPQ